MTRSPCHYEGDEREEKAKHPPHSSLPHHPFYLSSNLASQFPYAVTYESRENESRPKTRHDPPSTPRLPPALPPIEKPRRIVLTSTGTLPLRRVTLSSVLLAAGTDEALMHSGLHGVVLLDVKLGQLVVLEDARLLDITGGRLVHDGTH